MPEQNDDEESEEGGMKVCLCPEPVLAKHTLAVSLRRPEMNRDDEKNETIYLFIFFAKTGSGQTYEKPKKAQETPGVNLISSRNDACRHRGRGRSR
jgi:hypothetical protein